MPFASLTATERPANTRSRVTNGRRMFVEGDGRGPWARRRRDLEALYSDDLGGAAFLTEFQLSLVATAATLRIELERLEGQLSIGTPVDLISMPARPGTSGASARHLGSSVESAT